METGKEQLIAILHHHMEPGGVTSVIVAHSRLLANAGVPHVVLSASETGPPSVPHVSLPFLAYGVDEEAQENHASRLVSAASGVLGGTPTVFHFHNHSLGKSRLYPRLPAALARQGHALLLHIHDLCEDGRPQNFRRIAGFGGLYPYGPRIGYAFINKRDRKVFVNCGLPVTCAHGLANPMSALPAVMDSVHAPAAPLLLYPTRGIRRKNLGELLLLSLLAPRGSRAATTLLPKDTAARAVHDRWQAFAAEHDLPVEFAVVGRMPPVVGVGADHATWLGHATHLVSTSVQEGFGMVHLEAAALRKPLIARKAGVGEAGTGGLIYDALMIPQHWVDRDALEHFRRATMRAMRWAYGLAPGDDGVSMPLDDLDFGNLPEPFQEDVLRMLLDYPQRVGDVTGVVSGVRVNAGEWLVRATGVPPAPPSHGAPMDLPALYQGLNKAACDEMRFLPPERILSRYLAPERFHFLTAPDPRDRPTPVFSDFKCVICDVYGTLLDAPAGGVRAEPSADAALREILREHGIAEPPESPSGLLYAAVLRHHAASVQRWPEVDLRALWRGMLGLPEGFDATDLVIATEAVWHPAMWLPGAKETLRAVFASGVKLGVLSNAQCNTMPSLGEPAEWFDPRFVVLSYQHGMAKPSPELFHLLASRLGEAGISPKETLYVGNDPLQDILPACEAGFVTCLYVGHSSSRRPGRCFADHVLPGWENEPRKAK